MKLALMLGGMAAGRRAGGPGELLGQGSKLLASSPELSRLVTEVRGHLLEAGKGAVVAVATRQVEALTDRVGKRVESLTGGGAPRRGKAEEEPETDRYAEEEYSEDESRQDAGSAAEQDEEPAEEPAPVPPPRRPRAPARATAARAGKNPSASATVKRTASGAGRSAGRKPARATRTQGSDGRG